MLTTAIDVARRAIAAHDTSVMNTLLVLAPLVTPGGSVILGWLLTFVLVAAIIIGIIYLATRILGPPTFPEPVRWVLWTIIAIGLIVFLFAAFGLRLP
jgi:hypothetical protein